MDTIRAYLLTKYTEGSVKRYLRTIEIYLDTQGREKAERARYHDIWEYIGVLREKGLSIGHLSTELAGLKAYYRYLVHVGLRVDNPIRNVYLNDARMRDRQIQFQDLFFPAELELLLNKDNRYALLKYKTKLAISFYIYQGLTTGEMEGLTLKDIDLNEGTVLVRASDRLNSRILPLRNNQSVFLRKYLDEDRPRLLKTETDRLFITKLGTIEKGESLHYLIESQKGLFPDRNLNPKTVRQSVIVNWFRQGHGIKEVQIMAGHRFPSTTEGYRPTDMERLSNAIGRFHPLG